MTTKTKAIRALNDELRQNFTTGTAVMTAGVAALGPKPLRASSRQSPSTTISATPTTHTKSTTSARSKSMANDIFQDRLLRQIPQLSLA